VYFNSASNGKFDKYQEVRQGRYSTRKQARAQLSLNILPVNYISQVQSAGATGAHAGLPPTGVTRAPARYESSAVPVDTGADEGTQAVFLTDPEMRGSGAPDRLVARRVTSAKVPVVGSSRVYAFAGQFFCMYLPKVIRAPFLRVDGEP